MPRTSSISGLVAAWLDTTKVQATDNEGNLIFDSEKAPVWMNSTKTVGDVTTVTEILFQDSPELTVAELAEMGNCNVSDLDNIRTRLAGLKEPVVVFQIEDEEDDTYKAFVLDAEATLQARKMAETATAKRKTTRSATDRATSKIAKASADLLDAIGHWIHVSPEPSANDLTALDKVVFGTKGSSMVKGKNRDAILAKYYERHPDKNPGTQEETTETD